MSIKEKTILFVCTGNVFRSMTAEFAARRGHGQGGRYLFTSAGTHSTPDIVAMPHVGAHLAAINLDTCGHLPRRLDAAMVANADLVVAMNGDHRRWIMEQFGHDCRLFMEIATGAPTDLPDVCDVIENHNDNLDAANRHIAVTIDTIVAHMDAFLARLPDYLDAPGS